MKECTEVNMLVVFHHCDMNNGGVRSMLDIIDSLINSGRINIIALFPQRHGSAQDYLEEKGVECISVPFYRWDYDHKMTIKGKIHSLKRLNILHNYIIVSRLKPLLIKRKINVVYTNTITTNLGCLIKWMYKIPHIWHIREFGWEDHQLKIIYGEKLFYSWANQFADEIIVISESLKRKYSAKISKNIIRVIYDDVSKVNFARKPEAFFHNETMKLLIAGTLQQGKCQLDAVEAMRILRDRGLNYELFIAGSGNEKYRALLVKSIREYGLEDQVHLLGQVNDIIELRKEMHIALVCSECEAFGRVTVEAMLGGLCVIGANTAGTAELINHDETGILYKWGNVEALANAIQLLAVDRDKMAQIASNGQSYALNTFSSERCAVNVNKIIIELAERVIETKGVEI